MKRTSPKGRREASSANRAKALEKFVNGIDDIKIGIRAYSRQGN